MPQPIDEAGLLQRHRRCQRAFYRALGAASADATTINLAGVQVTVVPSVPWFAAFNSVFYEDPAAVAPSLPRIGEIYRSAGVSAWAVWVLPSDRALARVLKAAGHSRRFAPMALGSWLNPERTVYAPEMQPQRKLSLDPAATPRDVARLHDEVLGVSGELTLASAFASWAEDDTHAYVVRHDGRPVAGTIARDDGDDCYVWGIVATPHTRGTGIAIELFRTVLREARERGCMTVTGETIVDPDRLCRQFPTYRLLGRYDVWEQRS